MVCLEAVMIKSPVHIPVRTRVLSQCTTRDTPPMDILLMDMEEVMEDRTTGPWEGVSVNMTHISTMAIKVIMGITHPTLIISTRVLILRDPSRLDTARQEPGDMHLELHPRRIEDSKINLLPRYKYPTSAGPAHTTRPHRLDPHQPWEADSLPTISSNNTSHHIPKPAAPHRPQTDTLHTTINNPTITIQQPKAHHHNNHSNRAVKLLKASIERSRHELRRHLRSISIIRVLRSSKIRIISHQVARIDRLVC